ncbi:MAG TPA: NAD(P)H-binding protein [Dehalococcoidales bacterium]|nr:NAD(P)H-binding protein [Dehalococcoidales bacterium]
MKSPEANVVTGAFSHSGKYIAARLLAMGESVKTLTGHPERENSFGGRVSAQPLSFDNPERLAASLQGAATLYNTYWIRFPHRWGTFDKAVENSQTLIRAAEEAGVRRMVHISITNPSEESPFPYFRGKALVEKAIIDSKLSYAIVRPALIFGAKGILINNIAWLLRKFPVFAVPGSGDYRVQPIFVEDLAEIAVSAGHKDNNMVTDTAGPETFTFDELVRLIADKINRRTRIVHASPGLVLFTARLIGCIVGDVVLTKEEIGGLMANLLVSREPAAGRMRLSQWLAENAAALGASYASELKRH